MTPDYPAAHSMDTAWFAVDGDGHVAIFHTGEAGALPEYSCAYENAETVTRRLEEVMPPVPPILDVQGRFGRHGQHGGMGQRAHPGYGAIGVLLTSLAPVQEAIAAGRAIPIQASEGFAILLPDTSQEELNRYHQLPEFRGSFNLYHEARELPSAARWGVYEYSHATDNWVSGLYGRITLPAQPLHVDQLPPDVRDLLAGGDLDNIRFPDALHIQPVEHTPCMSWEAGYLDVTFRRIRPIPGKEEEYAKIFKEYYDSKEYELSPPNEDD